MLSQKPVIVFLLILIFLTHLLQGTFAQSRFFFSTGAGAAYYNGDLRDKGILPPLKIIRPCIDANLGYNMDKHLDLTLNYFKTSVNCADSLANEKDNMLRNQNFRSPVDEINMMIRYKLFRIEEKHLLNPYIMVGFGWLFFNPEANYNGEWYALQPLGTEGQYIPTTEENYPQPYKLNTQSLPIGFGVMVRINDYWKIKAEFIQHFFFTDYLDDTSNKYPDSASLSQTPNGYYAVIFSSRRPTGFPQFRRNRGNSSANDNYVNISIGVVYNPRRKKSYEFGRVNIFSKLFSGKGDWWGGKGKGLK